MRKTILTFFICLAAAGFTNPATAHKGGGNKFLKHFDANKDGVVSLQEFNESSAQRFAKIDANGDAKLTQEEFSQYRQQRRKEHHKAKFESMDTNNDGQVSKDEYLAHKRKRAEQRFASMDKNTDGNISDAEFVQGKRGGKLRSLKGHVMWKYWDKDGDGVVTKQESLEAWSQWFKRIDTNNDKTVSADELNAYRANKYGR
jgi:Ca2+-binding EF-hand superfamily protein